MSRNQLFKHLKSEGLEKPEVAPSGSAQAGIAGTSVRLVSGSTRNSVTCSDEPAGGALNHQDARGPPPSSKTQAELGGH